MRRYLKFYLLLFPIALFAQANQQVEPNGYNTFYYANGVVSSEGVLRDGKPDSYWKTYSDKGVLKSEGNRKNFQLDSAWKFYNETGKLAFEFNYSNGKKNGLKNTYDLHGGFVTTSENYVNDKKEGESFYYYKPDVVSKPNKTENDQLDSVALMSKLLQQKIKKVVPFIDGKKHGEGYAYSTDGTMITITRYRKGYIQKEEKINRTDRDNLKQGSWILLYPSGITKTIVSYVDDKMHGYLKEYAPNGSLKLTTKYVRGELQTDVPELAKLDLKTYYYKGGHVRSTSTYSEDGVPEGAHRKFSKDGKVVSTKVYSKGIVIADGILDTAGRNQGLWKAFYLNGKLKSIGNYVNGKKVGKWTYNYSNGKIEQQGSYDKKNRVQGIWKWYYPCVSPCSAEIGNLWREEVYVDDKREGSLIEYSDSGKVITKGELIDNEKEGPWILELADYREEGSYKAGKRDGEWKHYFIATGGLRFVGHFIDGVPDGKQQFYYESGKYRQTGKYIGGNREGEWKFYDETGYVFLTILYENNIEIRFDGIKVIPETVE